MPRKRTNDEFLQAVYNLVGDEYTILDEYINARIKVKIRHNNESCSNYEWSIYPDSFLNKNIRCTKCSGNNKKDTKQFKEEVYQLVGDEYEVIGEYINNKTNILIKHNKCDHEWPVTPHSFLSGTKCPICQNIKRIENSKLTYEQVKKFIRNLNYELISDEYVNSASKLILKDNEDYYYFITWNDLQQKTTPDKFNKSNPYTIQNIKLWCKLNNKPFELLSDTYEGSKKKLKWKCLKENCGEEFRASIDQIITNNQGCGVCVGKQIALSNCLATKNPELAKQWHPTLNGDLTPFDVTVSGSKDIWWQCDKGHEWPATINSRNSGCGCPYCAGQLPSKDYNLLVNNPELCEEWDYKKNEKRPEEFCPNSGKYAWWVCKECEHEWEAYIYSRNSGFGCPECCKSKGEKEIDRILINKNWIKISQEDFDNLIDEDKYNKNYFIPQMKFNGLVGLGNGLLSYDFYIPKLNLLIEYQGEQHEKYIPGFHESEEQFKKQLEHDQRKCIYAWNNNINLLEIWYWDFDNIEEILNKYIFN